MNTNRDHSGTGANSSLGARGIAWRNQRGECSFQQAADLPPFWNGLQDIAIRLAAWEQLGVERTFLTFWPPFDTLGSAVDLLS